VDFLHIHAKIPINGHAFGVRRALGVKQAAGDRAGAVL
jgi:hypothetical protein